MDPQREKKRAIFIDTFGPKSHQNRPIFLPLLSRCAGLTSSLSRPKKG